MNESSAAPTSANTPSSTSTTTRSILFEAVADLYEQIAVLKYEIAELKAAA